MAGVDACIDFDPTYLSIVGVTPITTALPIILGNIMINNVNGELTYSAGTLTNFPSGSFQIATIRFKAKEVISSTSITFSTTSPRKSVVAWQGDTIDSNQLRVYTVQIVEIAGTQTNASVNNGQISQEPGPPLKLQPAVSTNITKGEEFDLELRVDCAPEQPVAGVDACIDFDPAYLEVVNLTPITASLPITLAILIDNGKGQLTYSAGTLSNFPTGAFPIATIRFKAKEAVTSTYITFSRTPPRESVVAWQEGRVTLAGGTSDNATHSVTVSVNHFSSFFLAAGSEMYPPPVTTGTVGYEVIVQASVVNFVPVHSATLHYRVGTVNWTSLAMAMAGTVYQATIPASDVTPSGLAYYIEATDGSNVATYPTTNPINAPQVIALSGELASPGDADGNGVINVLDIHKVSRIILLLDSATSGADANQDGAVNVLDMTKIARIILELD